jgi:hypothetical protein
MPEVNFAFLGILRSSHTRSSKKFGVNGTGLDSPQGIVTMDTCEKGKPEV